MFVEAVEIDWEKIEAGSYLREVEAIRRMERIVFRKATTFFVGENGSGKSTLLEALAIACGFNPEGGTPHYNFSTRDTHSELYRAVRISRSAYREKWGYFLRAESFYNVATKEEEYGLGSVGVAQHLHERSHGEGFFATVQNNFRGKGLYFLDEPEAALSPQHQLALLIELARCQKQGAQFIIATHSPILLGLPGAEILSFDGGRIAPCEYEDTDSYRITSLFLQERELVLRNLLGE